MHTVGLPRTCIGFTNMLFFIFSTIGLIICVWCVVNTEFFKEVNYTVTKSSLVSTIANFVNLKLWLTPLTSILIPVALIVMMTSCCGIFGAGCKVKCAIKTYIFLVTGLSLSSAWIFFVSIIYNIYTKNQKTMYYMQRMIEKDYGKEGDVITYLWDYIMMTYECCGATGFKDFVESNWRTTHKDNMFPVQCCRLANKTALIPVSANCTTGLDVKDSYITNGCFSALRNAIIENKGSLIFYFIAAGWLYAMVIVFAFCIIKGQPLLGGMAGDFSTFLQKGSKPQEQPLAAKVEQSETSLENMMFAEEPPKKVVRVVSAMNPFQTYKLQQEFARGDHRHYAPQMRPHM